MAKERIPIPANTVADVLFHSDRTCCVCNERGKSVQVHHIDENPANNLPENLAVLCLQCHDETQISGGFGRKLNAPLVIRYRDDWVERVKQRREQADKNAIALMSSQEKPGSPSSTQLYTKVTSLTQKRRAQLLEMVCRLPAFRLSLEKKAQSERDSGVTSRMVQATYDIIDALEGVLVTLSNFYPSGTFGDNPQDFFSQQLAARFEWHRAYAEPSGPGTGGTIVHVLVVSNVQEDVEKMVADMAMALVGYDDSQDWRSWRSEWTRASPN